jgi:hypothetical protein
MSRFHGIRDITELDGPTFFALARRLPKYEGAVLDALKRLQEEVKDLQDADLMGQMYTEPRKVKPEEEEVLEGHVLTAEELERLGPPAPEIGQYAAIFEVVKCT